MQQLATLAVRLLQLDTIVKVCWLSPRRSADCASCVSAARVCVLLQTGRSTLPMPAGRPVIYGHAQKVTAKRYNKLPLPPSRGLCAPALLKGSEGGSKGERGDCTWLKVYNSHSFLLSSRLVLLWLLLSRLSALLPAIAPTPQCSLSVCICVCICVCVCVQAFCTCNLLECTFCAHVDFPFVFLHFS